MNNNTVDPVKKTVCVKLILNEGVSVEDFRAFSESEGTGADLKYLLDWDFHLDSLERKIVSFGEYGEVNDGDADWVAEEIDKVCECRIGRIAEESDGGCSLELILVDRAATRAKQRASDGVVLSDDGLELRSVPCDIVEFKFPASVKKIADYAFHECKKLTTIEIPGHVETIGMLAFGRCNKLKNVVVQAGCKHIGRAAFADCEELIEVSLPDTVKEIEPLAFSGDKNLAKVRMPDNLNEFGFSVFEDCPAFPDKMVVSGDGTQLLLCCDSGEELVVPEGIEEIADKAFEGCSKLRRLTLPSSVYMVGDDCMPHLIEEVSLHHKLDLRHTGLPDRARVVLREGSNVVSLCKTARNLKNACVHLLAKEESKDEEFELARNNQELRDMLFSALGAMVHGENLIRKALGHSIHNKCMEGMTDDIEQEGYGVKYGADFSESVRLAVCDARRLLHSVNELLDKDLLTRFMKEEHGHATICEIHHVLSCGQIQIDGKLRETN